jgi:hypothetical protein
MANKPTGLQKANQKRKNIKFAKNFPQKLATGKRMGKIKAAHEAMANPEASAAKQKAVESKLAKAKSLHEGLTGKSTSLGIKSEPQGTGLNVESKPKSQSQSIQEKQEAKLAERVKSYRDEAKKPKKMSLPTVQKGHGSGSVAPVKRGAVYGGVRSAAPVGKTPVPVNPYSGRTKGYSEAKHEQAKKDSTYLKSAMSREKAIKDLGQGSALSPRASNLLSNTGKVFRRSENNPRPAKALEGGHASDRRASVGEAASSFKKGASRPVMQKQQPSKPSSPSFASRAGGAIKSGAKGVYGAVTSPTAKGLAQAAFTHAGMAVMHGSNYPQKMHEYASRGPREFKPGWHGFTSPVEKPHAGEATDTKEERA